MVGKVVDETKDDHWSPTDKEYYCDTGQKSICSSTSSVNFVMLTWRPKKIQNMILQAHDEIKVSGVVESLLHFSLLSFKDTFTVFGNSLKSLILLTQGLMNESES